MNRQLTALILLLLMLTPVHAEPLEMEIIPLNHRLASDLIPVLKPLVDPGGTITGMNDQLIIRTGAENLHQIKALLQDLDRALRRLRITVQQGVVADTTHREQGLSAELRSGNVSARVGDGRHPREGLVIGHEGEDHAVRYRTHSTQRNSDQQNRHFVTTLEGSPAYIQAGQSIPLPTRQITASGRGIIVNDGVEYRDVTSGFYVTPRLNGQQVTLFIAPQLESVSDRHSGRINVQHSESVVSGRLGEWIYLGGADESYHQGTSGTLTTTRRRGSEQRNISVLVEEIH